MKQIEKIMVIIDPTAEAQPGLDRAVYLAEKIGAALELFVCYYDSVLSGKPFFDDKGLQKSRKVAIERQVAGLEKMAAPLRERGVPVSVDAAWDHPLDEGIVRKALKESPDLLVKDTHHHSALKRSIFSNTDWNLIRSCACPILLVKPNEWASEPKILAAVDPSHIDDKPASLDHEILGLAESMGQKLGAEIHVFHCFLPISTMVAGGALAAVPLATGATVQDYEKDMEAMYKNDVKELLKSHSVDEKNVHVVQGSPSTALPSFADIGHFDLVVMGAVARSRLERVFIGSTAETVLDQLPCDVLIVKPQGFVSPLA